MKNQIENAALQHNNKERPMSLRAKLAMLLFIAAMILVSVMSNATTTL